jgi:hypothetical protein
VLPTLLLFVNCGIQVDSSGKVASGGKAFWICMFNIYVDWWNVYGVHILDVCEGWRGTLESTYIWISLFVAHLEKGFLALVKVETRKTCDICQLPWTTRCFELELIIIVPNLGGKFNVVCWSIANVLPKDQ